MSTITWHPFPQEKPETEGFYLVTIRNETTGAATIDLDHWGIHSIWDQSGKLDVDLRFCPHRGFSVLAWMELPEPYEPPDPDDNHPDAVTARAYTAGDPETVKRLTIFE